MLKSVLTASLATASIATAADRLPPTIVDFTYDEFVTAGSSFKAQMHVTDVSGVDHINFNVGPTKGWWYPCSTTKMILTNGTAFDGIWDYECNVATNTPNGAYIFYYFAYDIYNNKVQNKAPISFTVDGGVPPDYSPPSINSITYPTQLNAGSTFTATLAITDQTGVSSGYMVVRAATGSYIACTAPEIVLDSGTIYDGVWKLSCYVDSTAPNGVYNLEMHLNDNQQNPLDYFKTSAFTLSGGQNPDLIKPTISNIKYSDSHVVRGETFEITATVGDAQSGINHVDFLAMETYKSAIDCKGPMKLATGSLTQGTWTYSCTVPLTAEITVHEAQIYAYDNQNNVGYMTNTFYVYIE